MHLGAFSFPVAIRSLHDAQCVDPDITRTQRSNEGNGVSEGGGEGDVMALEAVQETSADAWSSSRRLPMLTRRLSPSADGSLRSVASTASVTSSSFAASLGKGLKFTLFCCHVEAMKSLLLGTGFDRTLDVPPPW